LPRTSNGAHIIAGLWLSVNVNSNRHAKRQSTVTAEACEAESTNSRINITENGEEESIERPSDWR